jgi:hypothetical protein
MISAFNMEEPKHISYNEYKERLVNYIEATDYLKPYMPNIINDNERIEFMDYINAAEDLAGIIPKSDDEALKEAEKSRLFLNKNSVIFKVVKEFSHQYDSNTPAETFVKFLQPYINGDNIFYYNSLIGYGKIAKAIQNAMADNLELKSQGIKGVNWDRNVEIHDSTGEFSQITIEQLFNEIANAEITPDGYYKLPQTKIAVEDVAKILAKDYYIPTYELSLVDMDNLLEEYDIEKLGVPKDDPNLYKNTGPLPRFIDKDSPQVDFLLESCTFLDEEFTIVDILPGLRPICKVEFRKNPETNKIQDISPKRTQEALRRLNIPDNKLTDAFSTTKDTFQGNTLGYYECGAMLVVAIVMLVLAFIYR